MAVESRRMATRMDACDQEDKNVARQGETSAVRTRHYLEDE
jgi:hypothetical protein